MKHPMKDLPSVGTLGRKVSKPAAASPELVQVRPGILRDAQGRLQTRLPLPPIKLSAPIDPLISARSEDFHIKPLPSGDFEIVYPISATIPVWPWRRLI